ncbi:tetratricopeptide repeat protein [Pontibacter sp. G13]|uniref:tetratricopeptide repeat protein n=1 Tax=Pontibacter sp. G13 TaxID=3074898 RepID=UPI00288C5741|nr:tetratricopeptide repeat protein [Pontibacter sp. G13]WNJ18735.1 tetratricopeptide repeat protein [Pontibacter sp. G13]
MANHPDEESLLIEIGDIYQSKDFELAQEKLEDFLELYPNHAEAMMLSGQCEIDQGYIGRAQKWLKELRKVHPKSAFTQLLSVEILFATKKYKRVEQAVLQIRDAKWQGVHGNMSARYKMLFVFALAYQGRVEEASQHYVAMVEGDPRNLYLSNLIPEFLKETKSLGGTDERFFLNMHLLYPLRNDHPEAKAGFEELQQAKPRIAFQVAKLHQAVYLAETLSPDEAQLAMDNWVKENLPKL